MLCSQTFQESFDRLAQSLVCDHCRGPTSVTTSRRHFQKGQDGDTWGLVLVADIRMVSGGGELARAGLKAVEIIWAQVDIMKFNVVLDMSADRLAND
jgi:hypothetical protein